MNFLRQWRSILAIALIVFVRSGNILRADDDQVTDEFKIFNDGDDLLVPIQIEGKNYQFVLDTGCGITTFDKSLVRGEKVDTVPIVTANDNVDLPTYKVPKSSLGKHDLRDYISRIVACDLSNGRKISGHCEYGILGIDFLCHFVIEIDFENERLLLRQRVPIETKSPPIDLMFDENRLPYIRAKVADWCDVDFLIDTGDTGLDSGAIEARQCSYLLRLGDAKVVGASKIQSLSGDSEEHIIQARCLKLGDYKVANPEFSESKQSDLSLHYLSRFQVTMDFPHKKMYLTPNKSFNNRDIHSLSGMHLVSIGGKTILDSVDTDSVAEKAGVKAGDQIIKINEQSAEDMRVFEIRKCFCNSNSDVHITASRSGKEFATTLSLK